MSRYNRRSKIINDTEEYESDEIFENRGVKKITQYNTPKFRRLTREQYNSIRYQKHYWTSGDRFWKLASRYYGDVTKWWIIASFNFTPTEAELEEGQEIRIPLELPKLLGLLE